MITSFKKSKRMSSLLECWADERILGAVAILWGQESVNREKDGVDDSFRRKLARCARGEFSGKDIFVDIQT
jgi:hypothetical protein